MRISVFLFSLLFGLFVTVRLQAQDPGMQQDAEAAREKLLKASDQLDNIQANSEATKLSVDGMKNEVAKLQADVARAQTDNAALRQQLADLQAAFDKSEAARVKERQVLLDEVAKMVASGRASGTKKKDAPASAASSATSPPVKTPAVDAGAAATTPSPNKNGAPPADPTSSPPASGGNPATNADAAPVKTQKGYYHIVAGGETLTLICTAFRQEGVNVTVAEIRKANGLTDKSVLKVGQKLFIPKPGT